MDQSVVLLKTYINKIYSYHQGQIIIETILIFTCLLMFLLAVQFFQSASRNQIQKHRLTKQTLHKTKQSKTQWYK